MNGSMGFRDRANGRALPGYFRMVKATVGFSPSETFGVAISGFVGPPAPSAKAVQCVVPTVGGRVGNADFRTTPAHERYHRAVIKTRFTDALHDRVRDSRNQHRQNEELAVAR
jgi:hypothetical protein